LSTAKIHYTLFGQPDHDPHALMKRPVKKYYTTGAALALEPQMDRNMHFVCRYRRGSNMGPCAWLECRDDVVIPKKRIHVIMHYFNAVILHFAS